MNNIYVIALILITMTYCTDPVYADSELLTSRDMRIRDPFIHADARTKTYYMYAQSGNRRNSGFRGVEVYTSRDLVHWTPPQRVLTLPNEPDIKDVWAPEVHEYKGSYYLLVTLTFNGLLRENKPVDEANWPEMHKRGTYIYRAESPAGPFSPLKNTSHTPADWMALDGTLFVEDDVPYMIFCHEWVQMIDGTINMVQLNDDLSDTVGNPEILFRASDAPGAKTGPRQRKVTDGCFLYGSPKSGKLFMIWSTFLPDSGYCVILTESRSEKIRGPWINHKPIFKDDGGHGMLFRSFDGRLIMALHQPNQRERERLHLYTVVDNGKTLDIGEEVTKISLE